VKLQFSRHFQGGSHDHVHSYEVRVGDRLDGRSMSNEAPKTGGIESELEKIKALVEKYLTGETEPTANTMGDLTKAVRDLRDQVASHERRIEAIEEGHPEWTTHGGIPLAGSETPPRRSDISLP
jgi:hypothetical protein